MSIGNWRDHVLVNCKVCLKPMGYHLAVDGAICVDCETLALKSVDCEKLNADYGQILSLTQTLEL